VLISGQSVEGEGSSKLRRLLSRLPLGRAKHTE